MNTREFIRKGSFNSFMAHILWNRFIELYLSIQLSRKPEYQFEIVFSYIRRTKNSLESKKK